MADTERQTTKSFPCGETHEHCSVAEEYGICVDAVMGLCPFYNLKHLEIEAEAERLIKKYFPDFDCEKDSVTYSMLSKVVEGERKLNEECKELKPCPWCGEVPTKDADDYWYAVDHKPDCFLSKAASEKLVFDDTMIDVWNRRVNND